jgi:hypothetical protein
MNEYYDPATKQPVTEAQAWARLPPQNKAMLSPQEVASKTGLWVLSRVPTPGGYVAIGPTLYAEYPELQMAEAYRETITQEQWQAEQDAANAARIAKIAGTPDVQQALSLLSMMLELAGLAIPISEEAATRYVAEQIAMGAMPASSGLGTNIKGAWRFALQEMEKAGGTRDDVPAVWEAIQEAQA